MGETTNYNLYITEDSSEKFLDWRSKMNGTVDSNMVKIDTILAGKADASRTVNATLLAAGWSESGATYTQSISISGMGANTNGSISLAQDATAVQKEAVKDAGLSVSAQSDGSLTISADGTVPTIDIPVTVVLFG